MNGSVADMELVAAGTRQVSRWVEEPLRAVKYAVQDGVAIITLSRRVSASAVQHDCCCCCPLASPCKVPHRRLSPVSVPGQA
jgi:hypothetical protein